MKNIFLFLAIISMSCTEDDDSCYEDLLIKRNEQEALIRAEVGSEAARDERIRQLYKEFDYQIIDCH